METVNIGFIGAGDIANLHAEGIAKCTGAKLKGLWNRTAARASAKAELYNCQIYNTPAELVSDPEIDAIFVLTHIDTHHQFAKLAMEHGKHVLVEKPVGTFEEIEDLARIAESNDVKCVPVHNYVYEPGLNRAKDLIDRGQLGDIVSVYVMYNIYHPDSIRERIPGVAQEILTHHSYIALYLIGKPVSLSAMSSTISKTGPDREDIAMVTMNMKNGALGHFCASFAADDHAGDPWTCMVKVIGTKGATRFSYRDWVNNTPAEVHTQTYLAYPYSIHAVGEYFINKVIREDQPPLSSLQDAVIGERIVEACYESIETGKHIKL